MINRQTLVNAKRIRSYTDLKPGDYVVHRSHGIGKYLGMRTLKFENRRRDYLEIEYQGSSKVYIPVDRLYLIQKYVSVGKRPPHLARLNNRTWSRAKKRVSHRVDHIADELVSLYAKRDAEKGHAFPKDDARQRKFDAGFPYQLTPDQARSTKEIKRDMEAPKAMDRLLVGDVGYGKTEVAFRGAFKAIEGGKQVAMLVPTTVLAQQHYNSMLKRFAGFGIRIGILSRFDSEEQTQATIHDMKTGKLDLVVGTHRLLSGDIGFKDLGLLIIDEEQRFGVKHKDELKRKYPHIDVLMLTATPIPRTLNMAMLGIRDLSIIESPPTDRKPIDTHVVPESDAVIRRGILAEMHRHGQVFFLHNRVKSIEREVYKLKQLVPEAKIAYVDGEMNKLNLLSVLYDFIHGYYDVLVTTTIIETGVDIANVNTLFVENADNMGLAQLYQLRGRVGRSGRQAHAYLMFNNHKVISTVSKHRLHAMEEFTQLGSGFKIAMRDLSIRGAGNLLGSQQHGSINSVGYDMYMQLLNRAINRKTGKTESHDTEPIINVDIEAYIPSGYVNNDQHSKISIYRRLRSMKNRDQFQIIEHNLQNHYGKIPQAVRNLMAMSWIRMLASRAGIGRIFQHSSNLNLVLTMSHTVTQSYRSHDIVRAVKNCGLKAKFMAEHTSFRKKPELNIITVLPLAIKDTPKWLSNLKVLLTDLVKCRHQD